ncbi:MAG: phosphotransferase, partial [Pseudomonadota bacterium]
MTGVEDTHGIALAARALKRHYGLAGRVRRLHGELDQTFAVDADAGRFILKLMRPGCDPELVALQCAALSHLAQAQPSLPLPHVVPDTAGHAVPCVDDDDGQPRLAWLQTRRPGRPLSALRPLEPALCRAVGALLGDAHAGLASFRHPAADRPLRWNLMEAAWIGDELGAIEQRDRRRLITRLHAHFVERVAPALAALPTTVVHGDANTDNLLVDAGDAGPALSGLIDFGDLCLAPRVCDPAIACAYAMMQADDPVAAAEALIAGISARTALDDDELALVFPLLLTRLAVSVTVSALEKRRRPDDPYVTISEAPAWRLLETFAEPDLALLEGRLRLACGLAACRGAGEGFFVSSDALAPVIDTATQPADAPVVDTSFESLAGGDDPLAVDIGHLSAWVERCRADSGADCVIGRYGEPRALYTSAGFGAPDDPLAPRRTRHLGIDLFAAAGTAISAPLAGTVVACGVAQAPLDYGGYVVLRHMPAQAAPFDTVYGHLDPDSLGALAVGSTLAAGVPFATLGAPSSNGGWPPHLHFQASRGLDRWLDGHTPPGVCRPADFAAMSQLCPNPAA